MTGRDFDLIVLGLGPGGEDVAGQMAAAGWSVLGVDPALVGGECPYFGCVPSKMIIRAASVVAEARNVDRLAGHATVEVDYAPVARRIADEATDHWNDQVAVDRLTGKGGEFVRGVGRLSGHDEQGRYRVVVDGETYHATRVVIGTGTAPAIPPIDGLRELRGDDGGSHGLGDHPGPDGLIWTNREVMRATSAPASLIVLGGGAIGVELSQALGRLGTRVTVLEAAPRILAQEEPEASEAVAAVLAREGVDVRAGVKAVAVRAGGEGVEVELDDGTSVTAAKLLVAAGRRPNLGDIGLSTIGLDDSARSLEVDDELRVIHDGAPVENLYAVGDITGRGAFTHVSVWQAGVLAAALKGEPSRFGGYHGLAWVTFTDPEVGRVGLTEQQARDKGLDVRTATTSIASSTRGWIHGPGNDGMIKLVEDTDRGVLVGATVTSPYGGEILGLLTVAVHAEVPVATLATMHYAYPTLHRAVLSAVQELTG